MKRFLTYLLICCAALCGSAQHASAQIYDADGQYVDTIFHDHVNRQAEDFVEASLLISLPSNQHFHSVFGHAAIRLQCKQFGLDYVFNYAAEKMEEQLLQYLHGNLNMGLEAVPTDEYIRDEYRAMVEYPLYLPPHTKQKLWAILDQRVQEGLCDPYDCVRGSCAQQMFSYVNTALVQSNVGFDYGEWPEEYQMNIREIVAKYTSQTPWSRFWYFTLANGRYTNDPSLNTTKKLMFPQQLIYQWQHTTIDDHRLLSENYRAVKEGVGVHKETITPTLLAVLLLLMAVGGLLLERSKSSWRRGFARVSEYLIVFVQMCIGVVLYYLVCFSHLPFTEINWLLIPFSPLPIVLWHWRKYWALPYAGVLVIWVLALLIYPHALVEQTHIILAFAFAVVYGEIFLNANDWTIGVYCQAKSKSDKEVVSKKIK